MMNINWEKNKARAFKFYLRSELYPSTLRFFNDFLSFQLIFFDYISCSPYRKNTHF